MCKSLQPQTVSDGAEEGAGACQSTSISAAGTRWLQEARRKSAPQGHEDVLRLGAFSGIGGGRRDLELLGARVPCYISIISPAPLRSSPPPRLKPLLNRVFTNISTLFKHH